MKSDKIDGCVKFDVQIDQGCAREWTPGFQNDTECTLIYINSWTFEASTISAVMKQVQDRYMISSAGGIHILSTASLFAGETVSVGSRFDLFERQAIQEGFSGNLSPLPSHIMYVRVCVDNNSNSNR